MAWDMLQNQITMGNRWLVEASLPSEQKPILPPTDQLRSLLTLPNSLSSSRARMRTSSGSYLSVAVSVFLFGTRGPPGLCLWSRNPIMIIDCVHNLCFDRLADGSCGILCQPLSGSPESFLSETSRQQIFPSSPLPGFCQNGDGNPEKRGARF